MKWKLGDKTFEFLIGKKQEYVNPNDEGEEEILKRFIKNFNCDLKILHNSSNYSTVQYHDFDLMRLKYGDKAKWVEICIPSEIKKKYIDNPLFDAEKNKNRVFWKANINKVEDLNNFIDIIYENIQIRDEQD